MQQYHFMIFNRWGDLVFETDNPQQRWNGRDKNNGLAESGVYYYHTKMTLPHGDEYEKKGDVTLLR